jgi:hypothetical protein
MSLAGAVFGQQQQPFRPQQGGWGGMAQGGGTTSSTTGWGMGDLSTLGNVGRFAYQQGPGLYNSLYNYLYPSVNAYAQGASANSPYYFGGLGGPTATELGSMGGVYQGLGVMGPEFAAEGMYGAGSAIGSGVGSLGAGAAGAGAAGAGTSAALGAGAAGLSGAEIASLMAMFGIMAA